MTKIFLVAVPVAFVSFLAFMVVTVAKQDFDAQKYNPSPGRTGCIAAGGLPIFEQNPRGMIACIRSDAVIWPIGKEMK